jgi:hypothetical protein
MLHFVAQINEAFFRKKIAIGCNFQKNLFTFGLLITIYACPNDQSVITAFLQSIAW